MKIFKIKIVRIIFYLWGSIFLLIFLFANVIGAKKPYFPALIDVYLRNCLTEVAAKIYDSKPVKDFYTCEDKRLNTARNSRSYFFNSEFEILSSEILWSKDGQKFVVNVSGHVKRDFFFFLWDKPIWKSFDGESVVKGKSIQP
jgi:hypothetical protein